MVTTRAYTPEFTREVLAEFLNRHHPEVMFRLDDAQKAALLKSMTTVISEVSGRVVHAYLDYHTAPALSLDPSIVGVLRKIDFEKTGGAHPTLGD